MFITPYRRPTLHVPFELEVHPDTNTVMRHTMDWVRYFDLLKTSGAFKRFDAARFWLLSTSAYPHASKEDAMLLSDWIAWLFIQDDQFDEARVGRQTRRLQAYVEAAVSLLRQPRLATVREDGALLASLSELWQRLRARMNADLAARFTMAFEAYTTACLWELDNRDYGYTPVEHEYIAVRRDTSGFRLCALLIEMTMEESLPPLAREHPVLRKLQDLTNDVLSWTNDLFSLEKESKRKDMHNLVLILRENGNLPMQQAVDAVAARIAGAIEQFIELEAALPVFSQEADLLVQRYIRGLKAWMAANLHWSLNSGRYELEIGYVDQEQSDDSDSVAS
jgi:5-epi-alpha-selinene synthase